LPLPKTATKVNTSTPPRAVANPAIPVVSLSTALEAPMNVTSVLLVPSLLMLALSNAKSALLVLLKATEPNVCPALLVPTLSKLLKTLKNAILAPLVPSPRTPVQPTV